MLPQVGEPSAPRWCPAVCSDGRCGVPTCIRRAKSTRRPCRRQAAEWPATTTSPPPWWRAPATSRRQNGPPARKPAPERTPSARPAGPRSWLHAKIGADRRSRPRPWRTTSPGRAPASASPRSTPGAARRTAPPACATCDGYVCISCSGAEVGDIFESYGRCTVQEAFFHHEPDALPDGIATGPEPRVRLIAMVNQLVAATGTPARRHQRPHQPDHRGTHPRPSQRADDPPRRTGRPRLARPTPPVMFFAVLQEGRWPPGPV